MRDHLAVMGGAVERFAAQVADVRALHSRDERKAAMGLDVCAGCATHVTYTPWPCKTVQTLDVPPDVTR